MIGSPSWETPSLRGRSLTTPPEERVEGFDGKPQADFCGAMYMRSTNMGAARTSNKDILEAINGLTSAVMALVERQSQPLAAPVAQPVAEQPAVLTPASAEPTVKVAPSYLAHTVSRVEAKVKAEGVDYVIYARRNQLGETKLAYRKASQMGSLRDRGYLGKVRHIKAA